MAITRRVADEAVLRDPDAMRTYLHDVQTLMLNMSMELQIIGRVASKRLVHAPARGALMSPAEKSQAAKRISREMRRSAMLMSHISRMTANAEGILTEVFVPARNRGNRNNHNQNRGNTRNNNTNRRSNAA
jgi:hypothetical protein